jgi:hypothetical protein
MILVDIFQRSFFVKKGNAWGKYALAFKNLDYIRSFKIYLQYGFIYFSFFIAHRFAIEYF